MWVNLLSCHFQIRSPNYSTRTPTINSSKRMRPPSIWDAFLDSASHRLKRWTFYWEKSASISIIGKTGHLPLLAKQLCSNMSYGPSPFIISCLWISMWMGTKCWKELAGTFFRGKTKSGTRRELLWPGQILPKIVRKVDLESNPFINRVMPFVCPGAQNSSENRTFPGYNWLDLASRDVFLLDLVA